MSPRDLPPLVPHLAVFRERMGRLIMSPRPFLQLAIAMMSVVPGLTAGEARGGLAYPPTMAGARVEAYKTVTGTTLNLWIFAPAAAATSTRPAIVFFFGGGWQSGSPQQFETQCRHFAARGMVAVAADYRVKARHQVKPTACIADARSAIRWVRAHAAMLGIDPTRIAAAGGSAGGHLATAAALIGEFDEKDEDPAISAAPNALVLFNPGLVMAPLEGLKLAGFGTGLSEEVLGAHPSRSHPRTISSPARHRRSSSTAAPIPRCPMPARPPSPG